MGADFFEILVAQSIGKGVGVAGECLDRNFFNLMSAAVVKSGNLFFVIKKGEMALVGVTMIEYEINSYREGRLWIDNHDGLVVYLKEGVEGGIISGFGYESNICFSVYLDLVGRGL